MLDRFKYAAHDNASKWWGNRLQLLYLQASHGQGIGKLLRGECRVAKRAQPGFRKLHGETLSN